MKEIWRYIKGTDRKYQVSNYGQIKSKKRKFVPRDRIITQQTMNGRLYVSVGEYYSTRSVARLVLEHFRQKEIGKTFAVHINGNTRSNISTNLKWGTLGDIFRMSYESKKKKRGVYRFNGRGKNKWRAMIKIENKAKTIGYFKYKEEAELAYVTKYTETYGRAPY